MRLKNFGKTDLKVSEVVLGGGFVGGILIDSNEETKRSAMQIAFNNGINWIDTAPSYGQNKSEENIGSLLKKFDNKPIISTKVAIDVTNLSNAKDQIKRSVEESLKRLGQNSVSVLNLHNPITKTTKPTSGFGNIGVKEILRPGGILDGLETLKKTGLARYIGITALGETNCCHEIISTGRIDAAQIYYNMINPSAAYSQKLARSGQDFSGLLNACIENDVGTMAIRVFAAGVLATDIRHGREIMITDHTSVSEEEKRAKKIFDSINDRKTDGSDYGSRAQIALRYNLSNPNIDCTVVGLAELNHLKQVIGAVEAGPLPEKILELVNLSNNSDR